MIAPLERDDGVRSLDQGGSALDRPAPQTMLIGYGRGAPALGSGLERQGMGVRSFEDGAQAIREIVRNPPDLILVGDERRDGAGIPLIREIHREGLETLCFFLASSVDPAMIEAALEAGADDVCGPPHSVGAILTRRLVNLRRRDVPITRPRNKQSRPLTLGGVTVDPYTREVSDGRVPFTLSGRELELLVRLMEAAGDVVSRQKLLQEIWGDEQLDDAVLDATVHRLRKRLEERLARPGFVATVRGVGYRLKKD